MAKKIVLTEGLWPGAKINGAVKAKNFRIESNWLVFEETVGDEEVTVYVAPTTAGALIVSDWTQEDEDAYTSAVAQVQQLIAASKPKGPVGH